jgi:non-heme chloroperoxidase
VPIDASARSVKRLVPSAELVIYPGAPHGITDTHKDRLNNDLLTFVQS